MTNLRGLTFKYCDERNICITLHSGSEGFMKFVKAVEFANNKVHETLSALSLAMAVSCHISFPLEFEVLQSI